MCFSFFKVPVAGNPLFRQLYNQTLDSFPSAIFILSSAFLSVAAIGNLTLYLKRNQIVKNQNQNQNQNQDQDLLTDEMDISMQSSGVGEIEEQNKI